MSQNYILRVTAGPSYDPSTHQTVAVNTPTPVPIKASHTDVSLNVRIQNYHGLPHSSPSSSPYFSLPAYTTNQYSIAFSFTPKEDIPGDDLVFGNDFDHPIRDRLPPGFGTAFRIAKWVIDPGLEADVYADKPWLYGRFLSSINALRIGKTDRESASTTDTAQALKPAAGQKANGVGENNKTFDDEIGIVVEEGGVSNGMNSSNGQDVPDTAAARKKYFLTEKNRKNFLFEAGQPVLADFGNPYLDFNEFVLRLPGINLPVISYWDGQPLSGNRKPKRSHSLRYVLKNRVSGTVYLVVLFTLFLKEDVNEDGSIKEGADLSQGYGPDPTVNGKKSDTDSDTDDDDDIFEDAEDGGKKAAPYDDPNADDLD